MSEPMTGHKVLVTAGTYYGKPWIFLTCDCGWRLGFAPTVDPTELATAAAAHPGRTQSTTEQFKESAESLNTPADVQVDLNGAEQAVVDVLQGDSACSWHVGCDVEDCYGPRAAAIVAKLRPLIAAEALERFADKVDALPPGGEALKGDAWYRDGLRDAAAIARDEAAALRTTTPEKES
ncbi:MULTISPECIES: hypothetical protein [Glycomyces]|uniref:Uncharacterized protein n=2 Tax=Glycomyces TaxID=58113 RepID=A0ABU2AHW4_9ACTN|nr:hypothetical protein [Glycomyces lechevalierae]MDR7336802.1 hypothetical protein [Glycomyces lechevalierae]